MRDTPPPFSNTATPQTAGLATSSLVLGIVSFVLCLGPLAGIPAIICGHKARTKIARSNGALQGEGMGLAGLILGYVNLGVSLFMIPLLAAIAIPNFVKARTTAQMNACINNLRQIDGAKEKWAIENKKSPGDVPTMADLSAYLRNNSPTCPAAGHYTINPVGTPPKCDFKGHELPE